MLASQARYAVFISQFAGLNLNSWELSPPPALANPRLPELVNGEGGRFSTGPTLIWILCVYTSTSHIVSTAHCQLWEQSRDEIKPMPGPLSASLARLGSHPILNSWALLFWGG